MNFLEDMKERSWNSRHFVLPNWWKNYPTMMTREEVACLSWIAKYLVTKGDIVDLGPFLGGSTGALAWGTRQSEENRKIHSFDLFEINDRQKYLFLYQRGRPYFGGSDILPLYKKYMEGFSDLLQIKKTDILDEHWEEEKSIALLFIDICKSPEINDHVVSTFFPHLIPGSIVVQQDFLWFQNPWLYPTMHKLSDAIRFLSYTEEHMVVFEVHRTPSKQELHEALYANASDVDTYSAIEYFRSYFPYRRQREMIDAVEYCFRQQPSAKTSGEIKNYMNIKAPFQENPQGDL